MSGCDSHQRVERRGPLLRATQVEHRLAGLDDRAVDDPGRDRRDLAGDHRRHRLVEQRHATACLAHRDQGLPAAEPAERRRGRRRRTARRWRRPARRSRTRRPGARPSTTWSACGISSDPTLDAVVAGLLDEPSPPGRASLRLGHLAALHELPSRREIAARIASSTSPVADRLEMGRAPRPRRTPRAGR